MRIKDKSLIKYFETNEITAEVVEKKENTLKIKSDSVDINECLNIISQFPQITILEITLYDREKLETILRNIPENQISALGIRSDKNSLDGLDFDSGMADRFEQLKFLIISSNSKDTKLGNIVLPSKLNVINLENIEDVSHVDESRVPRYNINIGRSLYEKQKMNSPKVINVNLDFKRGDKTDISELYSRFPNCTGLTGVGVENLENSDIEGVDKLTHLNMRVFCSSETISEYKKFLESNPEKAKNISIGSRCIYNMDQIRRNAGMYLIPACKVKEYIESGTLSNAGKVFCIEIANVSELTLDDLKALNDEGCEFNVKVFSPDNSAHQDSTYTKEEYMAILNKLQELVGDIDENLPEKEKFAKIYERVALAIEYDYAAGYPKNDNERLYSRENNTKCRNLSNALLEGKAVCAGYSDVLKNACLLKGIECENVIGPVDDIRKEGSLNENAVRMMDLGEGKVLAREYHAWNKVKLDGVWYNCDPTWDRSDMLKSLIPAYALRSDEDYKQSGRPLVDQKGPKCDVTMTEEEKQEMFPGKMIGSRFYIDTKLVEIEKRLDEDGQYQKPEKKPIFKRIEQIIQKVKAMFSNRKALPEPKEYEGVNMSKANPEEKSSSWELDRQTYLEVKKKEQAINRQNEGPTIEQDEKKIKQEEQGR